MDSIESIVKTLEQKYSCALLRDEGLYEDNKDIDLALKDQSQKKEVIEFLIQFGFQYKAKPSKLYFIKKLQHRTIMIDIALNLDYLNEYFYDISIKKEIQQQYFYNPKQYDIAIRTLRYILFLRGRGEYLDFFYHHKEEIVTNNFYLQYLNKTPFKAQIDFESLIKILKKDPKTMFKYIKLHYFIYIIYTKIRFDIKRLFQ